MKTIAAPATQAVYHDFVVAPDTYIPIKRMFAAIAVDAELDRRRLARAIRDIVESHEILRTCPVTIDGHVVQEIRELRDIDEPLLVTTEWDETGAAISAIKRDLDNWWAKPRQLVIRPVLATSPTGKSYLLCAFNGCCMDGISAHFILDQIRAHYSGRPTVDSPLQFTDYYRTMIEEGHARSYHDWLRLIGRAAAALPDRMLKERESVAKAWIKVTSFDLSPQVMAGVDGLCREYSCTRFEALAVSTELYFRRDDNKPAGVGILHGGRRGPRSLEVAGLLRTQIMDLVEIDGNPTAGESFRAQLESLRAKLRHFTRLPVEDVCLRAGMPAGFRVGDQRLWEVSIISRFSRFLTGKFGETNIESVAAPLQDDWYCENGGPTFSFNFSIQKGQVTGGLQYVNPPVDDATAIAVIAGVQEMMGFVRTDPTTSISSGPAFFRLVS
ncbi:MAG TPA: condensation domain-containing protein [Pseudonocardiaceae bacterium]|nr:condensation domain-containing protein [Pseudonocardiaceae bacterium]